MPPETVAMNLLIDIRKIVSLCDKIMILKSGESIFCGTIEEALAASPYEKLEDAYLWYTDGRMTDKLESIWEEVVMA